MENNCNPGCNCAKATVTIPLDDLNRLIRESERYNMAKEIFGRFRATYDLEKTLRPILMDPKQESEPKEESDE